MRILSSHWRIAQRIFICLALATCLARGTLAHPPSKLEELVHTQKSGGSEWPLVGAATHTKDHGLVRFTFANPSTGKEFKQPIQATLLKGIQEIVGGYYLPGSKTAVIFAYIKNLSELQMLNIGFRQQLSKWHIVSFRIGALNSDAANTARDAYQRLGAAGVRRTRKPAAFRFTWPPRKRRRCSRLPPECIPSPQPSLPPAQPPATPKSPSLPVCEKCTEILVLCGDPSSTSSCQKSMFVERHPGRNFCTLCLGDGALSNTLRQPPSQCGKILTREEFKELYHNLLNGITVENIRRQLQSLSGDELLNAIQVFTSLLFNVCGLADEYYHIVDDFWCLHHNSCGEAQSAVQHTECRSRPEFKQLLLHLLSYLDNRQLFPEPNPERDKLRNRIEKKFCADQLVMEEIRKFEQCVCCKTRNDDGNLTMEECEECIPSVCKASPHPSSPERFRTSSSLNCEQYRAEVTDLICKSLLNPDKDQISHSCQAHVNSPNPILTYDSSKGLAAMSYRPPDASIVCPEPPPSPLPRAGGETPAPRYQCPSGPGVAPGNGQGDIWTSDCRATTSLGEVLPAPLHQCERRWNGTTWALSKDCPLA